MTDCDPVDLLVGSRAAQYLTIRRNQGSFEKWLSPGLEQEKHNMNLERTSFYPKK